MLRHLLRVRMSTAPLLASLGNRRTMPRLVHSHQHLGPLATIGAVALCLLIFPVKPPPAHGSATTPDEIISVAKAWVAAKVPYDQRQTHDGYREDCSGLASAAWGLPTPGSTTYTLPQVANQISKD